MGTDDPPLPGWQEVPLWVVGPGRRDRQAKTPGQRTRSVRGLPAFPPVCCPLKRLAEPGASQGTMSCPDKSSALAPPWAPPTCSAPGPAQREPAAGAGNQVAEPSRAPAAQVLVQLQCLRPQPACGSEPPGPHLPPLATAGDGPGRSLSGEAESRCPSSPSPSPSPGFCPYLRALRVSALRPEVSGK